MKTDSSSRPEHNPTLDPEVVKADTRAIRAKWIRDAVIIALLVACLVYLVQTLGAVRDTQESNVGKIDSSAAALELIKDCTTRPQSDCAKKQNAALADFTDVLHDDTLAVVSAVISCQEDGITGETALAKCAASRL